MNPEFYYSPSRAGYGYTDDNDDDYYGYNQIPGIADFRIAESGAMKFSYPWGCNTICASKSTLQLFDPTSTNFLEAASNVFVKKDPSDDSVVVSWERAQGKNGDGDVNIQAQLFTDGSIRVCLGCGELPADLNLDILFEKDSDAGYDSDSPAILDGGVRFGPPSVSNWPADQCFTYTPPETAVPSQSPTREFTCPASSNGFDPIGDDPNAADLLVTGFNFASYAEGYGYTDDKDDGRFDQIPNFDDADIYIAENGKVVLSTTEWGCEGMPCNGTTILQFVQDAYYTLNPLDGVDKVFIKDTSVGGVDSFLVSWEDSEFETGTGAVNMQAEFFSTGITMICFGSGPVPMPDHANLDVQLTVRDFFDSTLQNEVVADLKRPAWPTDSCYCNEHGSDQFQPVPIVVT